MIQVNEKMSSMNAHGNNYDVEKTGPPSFTCMLSTKNKTFCWVFNLIKSRNLTNILIQVNILILKEFFMLKFLNLI